MMPQGSVGPDWLSFPENVLEFLHWEGGFLIFQIKDETERIPTELFPLLQTLVLYLSS